MATISVPSGKCCSPLFHPAGLAGVCKQRGATRAAANLTPFFGIELDQWIFSRVAVSAMSTSETCHQVSSALRDYRRAVIVVSYSSYNLSITTSATKPKRNRPDLAKSAQADPDRFRRFYGVRCPP
jgi:hypothetical protein